MTRIVLFGWMVTWVLSTMAGVGLADDWPQWLGPRRDSVWRETGIVAAFPPAGPPVRWRVPVAGGYAGPAVAEGRVFVMDYVTGGDRAGDPNSRSSLQGEERVLCFSATDGRLLWKHAYQRPYDISYPAGPRATPTVDGQRVYALGAEGNLLCLNIHDGTVIWACDFARRYKAKTALWGCCDLIIARLSPEGYNELSRARIIEPTSTAFGRNVWWSHPAFANRCVYARNDQELVCVSLADESVP